MNPTTQPSEGAVRAAEWIASTFTGEVHPLHVARMAAQIDKETGVGELVRLLRESLSWVETYSRVSGSGEILDSHIAVVRQALSRHTSTQGKEGKL